MTISAGIGIANFPFDDARGFWRWVDLCDSGGVDSIWQSDRLIGADANLECMSVMAALAGATKRIKFGMNVASMGLRDPVITAKACATIDVLSEGRLLPAFGVGSALGQDYASTGIPTKGRGQRTSEGLEIMARLWAEDNVTFEGRHYQLKNASIAPKPVQKPLPLWVGGTAAEAVERTARFGTGWQAGLETAAQVAPVVSAIKARAAELGRPIDADHYGAGIGFRLGDRNAPIVTRYRDLLQRRLGRDPADLMAVGEVSDVMEQVRAYRQAGIHKFVLRPIAHGADDVMAQTRLMVERILPEVATLS